MSENEVHLEAQRDKKKVHFATLMDKCHSKNAELELQSTEVQWQSRVPKRRLGACAVFTEQSSSASR